MFFRRKRERERDRQTDRKTDREKTDIQTDRDNYILISFESHCLRSWWQ